MDLKKCKEKFNNKFKYVLHPNDTTKVNVCCPIHRMF